MAIKILYMNIQCLSYPKLVELVGFFSQADIFCFTETWKFDVQMGDLNLEGFTLFYRNREDRHPNAYRNSSGLAIYVKSCYYHAIDLVPCSDNDIMWLRFCKSVWNIESDLYFGLCYVPPSGSSYHELGVDIFDKISVQIAQFTAASEVIVFGDFNARIG